MGQVLTTTNIAQLRALLGVCLTANSAVSPGLLSAMRHRRHRPLRGPGDPARADRVFQEEDPCPIVVGMTPIAAS